MRPNFVRIVIGIISAAMLLVIFLYQRIDVAGYFHLGHENIHRFLINRFIRFLLNDIFAIGLIFAFFNERKYVVFAVWVQLAGMILFLFPYFILKLNYPKYNGPLINFLHRLILNPTLLLLLIPAIYYQRQISRDN